MIDKSKYVQRFKEIYQKKTGEVISDEESLHYFQQLITLVDATHGVIPKKHKEINNY